MTTLIAANDNRPDRLLKLTEVRAITSLGRTTVYRKMDAGTFPRPLQLSEKCVRWRESEVVAWIDSLPYSSATPA